VSSTADDGNDTVQRDRGVVQHAVAEAEQARVHARDEAVAALPAAGVEVVVREQSGRAVGSDGRGVLRAVQHRHRQRHLRQRRIDVQVLRALVVAHDRAGDLVQRSRAVVLADAEPQQPQRDRAGEKAPVVPHEGREHRRARVVDRHFEIERLAFDLGRVAREQGGGIGRPHRRGQRGRQQGFTEQPRPAAASVRPAHR
jgi:hypothetical protein